MSKFQQRKSVQDGLVSFQNSLANKRNAQANNAIVAQKLDYGQMREIFRTGLGNKIIRLKTQGLLKDSLVFSSQDSEDYFYNRLKSSVEDAVKWMMAFGRGIVVIQESGADLSKPIPADINLKTVQFKVFSGDLVTPAVVDMNLSSPRYYKPTTYSVRGEDIHWTRVIDFTYVRPSEIDLPRYQYGGISEFELIHEQLVNDGIVQRVVPHIIEKNSTIFYKVDGFKDLLASKREDSLLQYFSNVEDYRSVYGAGILDKMDDVQSVSQAMTNLSESDMITLRRIAMVTNIPMALLVGENVKGLNSTGDHEMSLFHAMLDGINDTYIEAPLKSLFSKLGLGDISFKPSQGETPEKIVAFQSTVIENATKLFSMGLDYEEYLVNHGIVMKDDITSTFEEYFNEES